jgi:hypothetical protein
MLNFTKKPVKKLLNVIFFILTPTPLFQKRDVLRFSTRGLIVFIAKKKYKEQKIHHPAKIAWLRHPSLT